MPASSQSGIPIAGEKFYRGLTRALVYHCGPKTRMDFVACLRDRVGFVGASRLRLALKDIEDPNSGRTLVEIKEEIFQLLRGVGRATMEPISHLAMFVKHHDGSQPTFLTVVMLAALLAKMADDVETVRDNQPNDVKRWAIDSVLGEIAKSRFLDNIKLP